MKEKKQNNESGKTIKGSIQNNFPKTKEIHNSQFKQTPNPRKNNTDRHLFQITRLQ